MPNEPPGGPRREEQERLLVKASDVLALTAKGTAELKGGSTSLGAAELELLVLIDGRAKVEQVARRVRGMSAEEVAAGLSRLVSRGLVEPAKVEVADAFEASFFSLRTISPSGAAQASAEKEADTGTLELRKSGFYVSIARARAEKRKLPLASPLSILIVEDDPQLSKLLNMLLRMDGHQIRVAASRDEIVQALRDPPRPDLVLLDIVLPDVNGFDILQRMQSHPQLKEVPVIVLTNQATRESVAKGLMCGAAGYVTKPFEVDVLLKAVRVVLGLA